MLITSTGLLIVVGVVLDTMKQLEAQLLMRHYEGFHSQDKVALWISFFWARRAQAKGPRLNSWARGCTSLGWPVAIFFAQP
jgi:hypothetical protein